MPADNTLEGGDFYLVLLLLLLLLVIIVIGALILLLLLLFGGVLFMTVSVLYKKSIDIMKPLTTYLLFKESFANYELSSLSNSIIAEGSNFLNIVTLYFFNVFFKLKIYFTNKSKILKYLY